MISNTLTWKGCPNNLKNVCSGNVLTMATIHFAKLHLHLSRILLQLDMTSTLGNNCKIGENKTATDTFQLKCYFSFIIVLRQNSENGDGMFIIIFIVSIKDSYKHYIFFGENIRLMRISPTKY